MAFDPVPWFVGGGAEHSPEVARMVAYAALRGNEGIMGASDFTVRALAVPGPSIRIAPGACAITCRAAGGAYQSYTGRAPSETTIGVAATGGSARSDLVVVRVEDPFMLGEPWANPEDPKVGPYLFPRVIPNVPNTTTSVAQLGLGYSAIALARIDMPASTGTVTQAMIKDLRRVANPRRERRVDAIFPPGAVPINTTGFKTLGTSAPIVVPTWATAAKVVVTLSGLALLTGHAFGTLRAQVGSSSPVYTQTTTYDENFGGSSGGFVRSTYVVAGELTIPAALRGTTLSIFPQGARATGPGFLQADSGSTLVVDVEWLEVPE